jgi:hypothetical protein
MLAAEIPTPNLGKSSLGRVRLAMKQVAQSAIS